MGFLDKVKSLKNALTGGGATVDVSCAGIRFGEPFVVQVRAEIGEAAINANRVYLKLIGEEALEINDFEVELEVGGEHRKIRENIHRTKQSVNLELPVCGKQTLAAGETYDWDVEVTLPKDAPPIYTGHFCRHYYRVQAGIDCFGNDPDSDWLELVE